MCVCTHRRLELKGAKGWGGGGGGGGCKLKAVNSDVYVN